MLIVSDTDLSSQEGGNDPYSLLGVSPDSSFEEIQEARDRKLSQAGEDLLLKAKIESCYDSLLMVSLKERQLGKVSNEAASASALEEKNNDMYFIATEGDRCDNLANRFYGDATLWWFIARVNNLTTNNIPAGTSLRIPINTKEAKGF